MINKMFQSLCLCSHHEDKQNTINVLNEKIDDSNNSTQETETFTLKIKEALRQTDKEKIREIYVSASIERKDKLKNSLKSSKITPNLEDFNILMEKCYYNKEKSKNDIKENKKLNDISLKLNELINECIIKEDSSESDNSKDSIY